MPLISAADSTGDSDELVKVAKSRTTSESEKIISSANPEHVAYTSRYVHILLKYKFCSVVRFIMPYHAVVFSLQISVRL